MAFIILNGGTYIVPFHHDACDTGVHWVLPISPPSLSSIHLCLRVIHVSKLSVKKLTSFLQGKKIHFLKCSHVTHITPPFF